MIDPREEFNLSLSERVQSDFVKMLFEMLGKAPEVASAFDPPERHDVIGHIRQALVNQGLRAVARRHSLEAEPIKNVAKNSFHTEVRVGRVLLTTAQVQSPSQVVREALYRDTLAELAQGSFFDKPKPSKDALLYAILLWGVHKNLPTAPAFAHIQFPASSFVYVGGGVDLFRKFPTVVQAAMPTIRRAKGTGDTQ